MIDLYYWTTPNGHKITLFLEEAGLQYRVIPVNIGKGEQFAPAFLQIAPNNRILYLADKTGRFVPQDVRGRTRALEWLFWQMGGLGPMAGQNHHFRNYAPEKIPYAIERYGNETNRLYGVLDRRLADRAFVAGPEYTIADMASYPWILPEAQGQSIDAFPHLKRWHAAIKARPATARAYDLVQTVNPQGGGIRTEAERRVLFGQTATSHPPRG